MTGSTTPAGGTTAYKYGSYASCSSSPGDLVARVDARNITTCYGYDADHRLVSKTYSDGTPAVTYAYGQTSALGVSSLANTTGRLSSESTSADAGQVFSYDARGRAADNWEFTPQVWGGTPFELSYGYDLAGDVTSEAYSRGASLSTAYDLAGRPLSLGSSASGTLISGVAYNAFGEETSASLGNGLTETRGYDARGRLTSIADSGGAPVGGSPGTGSITISGTEGYTVVKVPCEPYRAGCYQYIDEWDTGTVSGTVNGTAYSVNFGQGSTDASLASALASSINGSSIVTASASGGVVTIIARSDGSNTNYSLSASANSPFTAAASGSSLTGGSNPQPPPGAYSLSSVTYAPDGDLLSSTDSANGSFSFGYNDLNQLVTAACSSSPCTGDSAAYAYDRWGNRWSESGTLPAAAPTALSFSGSTNRISGWSYDASGNLLSDGVHTYQYDAENRLISVDNGSTASYVYGPEGRRVHEDVGGVVKEFVYGAGGQELTVVNASQGLIAGETYVGGRYLGTQTASAFVWAASDELGTARVRTNASGAPIETDTSWPFGAYLNNVGSVSNLHFTGKYRDGSSGLDYFGARYYDSGLGRFLTPDWSAAPEATPYANLSDPQSLNPYIYEGNNPASDVDKDGHCWPWCTALAGAGIGAVVGGGSEALAEWMRGQPLSASRIEHAAEGGAIAGAIIGAIGPEAAPEAGLDEAGGSAWNKIGGTILGNLVGGAAERKLNGQAVADPKALEIDAGTGALGGTFAAIAGKAVASTAIREAATDAAGVGTSAATREGPAKPVCKENTPCAKGSGPASGAAQPSTGGGAQ